MVVSSKRNNRRNNRGALATVLLSAGIIVAFGLGCLAVDTAHAVAVQTELRNATDAGALAGAQSLTKNFYQSESIALEVAAKNTADGVAVSNDHMKVTAKAVAPSGTQLGTVTVTAAKQINHLFGAIIGRHKDTLQVTSVAGTHAAIREVYANQLFPITVSIDAVPDTKFGFAVALKDKKVGDMVDLNINSQKFKNAAFTSLTVHPASGNYIKSAIDQSLGLEPIKPGFIPSVEVGDSIYLNNGVVGQKRLAQDPHYGALYNRVIVIPIIQGPPPYNQSREVIGFVGVKVTDVTINQSHGLVETISGIIVTPILNGDGDPNVGGTGPFALKIRELSPGPVKLIL